MPPTKSLLRSLLAIGAAGAVAAFGTFSAFSSTTENPGNQIDTGVVALSDNDSGSALYNVSNGEAGTTVDRCITVTYGGDLDADVKLYLPDAVAPLGQYVDLTITPGTDASPSFGDCTGFVADGAALYTGTLGAFQAAHNSWANGLADNPGSATKWVQNDTVTYRVPADRPGRQQRSGQGDRDAPDRLAGPQPVGAAPCRALSAARLAGLAAGLSLVGRSGSSRRWRVPGATRPAAAIVALHAVASGEVGVDAGRTGPRSESVVPGGAAVTGRVRLSNQHRRAAHRARAARRGRRRPGGAGRRRRWTVRGRVVYRGPAGRHRAAGRSSCRAGARRPSSSGCRSRPRRRRRRWPASGAGR